MNTTNKLLYIMSIISAIAFVVLALYKILVGPISGGSLLLFICMFATSMAFVQLIKKGKGSKFDWAIPVGSISVFIIALGEVAYMFGHFVSSFI